MQQRTLLFIDDDKVWLRTVKELFTQYKYHVLVADNPLLGLSIAKSSKPDCVLLDLSMPGLDGAAVAARLRSDPELMTIPIIVVSGADEKELDAYREYQADGFFLKGSSYEKARVMIDGLLRRVDWDRGVIRRGDLSLHRESLSVFRNSKFLTALPPAYFWFLFLLMERTPEFVSEAEICARVLKINPDSDKAANVKIIAHRLREKLGLQVGRRMKSKKAHGWIYVPPRNLITE